MKTVTIISRGGLKRVYGDYVPLMAGYCKMSDTNSYHIDTMVPVTEPIIGLNPGIDFPSLELIILKLKVRRANDYSNVLVPKDIVESINIEDVGDIFSRVLEEMLPGRWVKEGSAFFLSYPEIQITNSNGESHTIYDLVVRVDVDLFNDVILTEIHGARCSFTKAELKASYVHSHLPKISTNYQKFCLGNSEFYRFIKSNFNKVDDHIIRTFLLQLELYLAWESLEGKPHISMSAIKTIQNEEIRVIVSLKAADLLIDYCIDFIKEMNPLWLVHHFEFLVFDPSVDPDKVYELELKLNEKYKDTILKDLMYDYDPNTGFYSKDDSLPMRLPAHNSSNTSIFNRLRMTPRLIETEEIVNPDIIKRFAPTVINRIITEINKLLSNNFKVNEENNVRTQSEDNNIPAASESSLVPA